MHRQTEGNPLFVQEVLRYLVEEGLVVREGGRYVPHRRRRPRRRAIPEGLRDVIGKRLSRLSAECNRLLAIAAVIGRDFRLDTLQRVAAMPEEELLAALEEAVRVGVLEERSRPGAVRLPLHARLLPPDAVRGDDRAAAPAPAPAGGAGPGGAVRAAGWTSTRRSWRSTSPSRPTAPTWRRRWSTASWRRSGR